MTYRMPVEHNWDKSTKRPQVLCNQQISKNPCLWRVLLFTFAGYDGIVEVTAWKRNSLFVELRGDHRPPTTIDKWQWLDQPQSNYLTGARASKYANIRMNDFTSYRSQISLNMGIAILSQLILAQPAESCVFKTVMIVKTWPISRWESRDYLVNLLARFEHLHVYVPRQNLQFTEFGHMQVLNCKGRVIVIES